MRVGEGACRCFWLELTGMVRLGVRRFTYGLVTRGGVWPPGDAKHRACPALEARPCESGEFYQGGCDAWVDLGIEIPMRQQTLEDGYQVMRSVPRSQRIATSDQRWPTACAKCGQPFNRLHLRQWTQAEVYVRSDTGERVALRGYGGRDLSGALYDAWWLHGRVVRDAGGAERGYVGPDGIALVAICPNGVPWEVDGPSRSSGTLGPGWTRTGSPKDGSLQVTPSIVAGKPGAPDTYHGWLGVNGAPPGHFSGHLG